MPNAKYLGSILLALMLACAEGSDDGPSEHEQACDALAEKIDACQLTIAKNFCKLNDPCVVHCALDTECDQLRESAMPTGEYVECLAACSGARPEDFICADGRQFVLMSGVCDGQFDCLDGSDEASCDDAGTDPVDASADASADPDDAGQ